MSLTELSGIGSKTAEKLKREGIDSKRELAEARRRGDPALDGFSSRVQKAARDAAIEEFGRYEDPSLGVAVSEENRTAVETFASEDVNVVSDAGRITRNNRSIQGESLLELGRQAARGGEIIESMSGVVPSQQDISDTTVHPSGHADGPNQVEDREKIERRQARRNVAEMAFDVAGNIAEADRGTIAEANELRAEISPRTRRAPKTDFTETYESEIAGETQEFERDVRVDPVDYAAAKRVHNARPAEAKRVDNRRKAERVTGDYDEWVEQPGQVDFPGVDTPKRGPDAGSGFGFTPEGPDVEATVAPRGGFQVREASTDGGGGFGRIESKAGELLSAPQEQQRLILGPMLPDEEDQERLGLEPRGPDEELFSGRAEGDFL